MPYIWVLLSEIQQLYATSVVVRSSHEAKHWSSCEKGEPLCCVNDGSERMIIWLSSLSPRHEGLRSCAVHLSGLQGKGSQSKHKRRGRGCPAAKDTIEAETRKRERPKYAPCQLLLPGSSNNQHFPLSRISHISHTAFPVFRWGLSSNAPFA